MIKQQHFGIKFPRILNEAVIIRNKQTKNQKLTNKTKFKNCGAFSLTRHVTPWLQRSHYQTLDPIMYPNPRG